MAIPENVLTAIKAEHLQAQTLVMTEIKGNVINSNNLTRLVVTKKFDEVGSIESRSVDKVLQLPKLEG